MQVVFRRPGHDQTAVPPSVNMPAAPVRFMDLIVGWRNQIPVGYFSIEKEFFFPGFEAAEFFLGATNFSYIPPAELLDRRGFTRKQNDGQQRRFRFLLRILGRTGRCSSSMAIRVRSAWAIILAGVRPRFVAMIVKLFSLLGDGSTVTRIQGLSELMTACAFNNAA